MFRYIKRAFDCVSASVLFLVLLPLFLLLTLLVWISLGRPVFFRQTRSGMHRKPFNMLKYRTMTNRTDADGNLLSDEERLTPIGKILRATSLDELPELLLIIRGDMSVIGPRPLPPRYDPYYSEREQLRFSVRGGLLPPEVLYHNVEPTWDEQLEYEAAYAENLSLKQDVKIFFAAFSGLFSRARTSYGTYVRSSLDEERSGALLGENT